MNINSWNELTGEWMKQVKWILLVEWINSLNSKNKVDKTKKNKIMIKLKI